MRRCRRSAGVIRACARRRRRCAEARGLLGRSGEPVVVTRPDHPVVKGANLDALRVVPAPDAAVGDGAIVLARAGSRPVVLLPARWVGGGSWNCASIQPVRPWRWSRRFRCSSPTRSTGWADARRPPASVRAGDPFRWQAGQDAVVVGSTSSPAPGVTLGGERMTFVANPATDDESDLSRAPAPSPEWRQSTAAATRLSAICRCRRSAAAGRSGACGLEWRVRVAAAHGVGRALPWPRVLVRARCRGSLAAPRRTAGVDWLGADCGGLRLDRSDSTAAAFASWLNTARETAATPWNTADQVGLTVFGTTQWSSDASRKAGCPPGPAREHGGRLRHEHRAGPANGAGVAARGGRQENPPLLRTAAKPRATPRWRRCGRRGGRRAHRRRACGCGASDRQGDARVGACDCQARRAVRACGGGGRRPGRNGHAAGRGRRSRRERTRDPPAGRRAARDVLLNVPTRPGCEPFAPRSRPTSPTSPIDGADEGAAAGSMVSVAGRRARSTRAASRRPLGRASSLGIPGGAGHGLGDPGRSALAAFDAVVLDDVDPLAFGTRTAGGARAVCGRGRRAPRPRHRGVPAGGPSGDAGFDALAAGGSAAPQWRARLGSGARGRLRQVRQHGRAGGRNAEDRVRPRGGKEPRGGAAGGRRHWRHRVRQHAGDRVSARYVPRPAGPRNSAARRPSGWRHRDRPGARPARWSGCKHPRPVASTRSTCC